MDYKRLKMKRLQLKTWIYVKTTQRLIYLPRNDLKQNDFITNQPNQPPLMVDSLSVYNTKEKKFYNQETTKKLNRYNCVKITHSETLAKLKRNEIKRVYIAPVLNLSFLHSFSP